MKQLDAQIIENAAFEAHMVVADVLRRELGRDPKPVDVAQALTHAYGDAFGLYLVANKPTTVQAQAMNAISSRACNAMVSKIAANTCVGSA